MINILIIVLVSLFAIYGYKLIKKKEKVIYIIASILSIGSYFILNESTPINAGFVGLAFFIIVMMATSFTRGSLFFKRFVAVRKEFSILGFIFILPHGIFYLLKNWGNLEWYGVIAVIIMIPLFITSFMSVRKKMKAKTWKNLQRLAYIIYLLIFIHLMIIGESGHLFIYIGVFGLYTFLKVKNTIFKDNNLNWLYGLIATALLLVASYLIFIYEEENTIEINQLGTVTETNDNDEYIEETVYFYEDGTYNGTADGYKYYEVEVNVTIKKDIITDIDIIDCGCSSPAKGVDFEAAADELVETILTNNSLDVDTVSGATSSTSGLIEAVNIAVTKAKK